MLPVIESQDKMETHQHSHAPLTAPEHKKYRLRPIDFSKHGDIYRKYFHPIIAKRFSLIQIVLGIGTIITEV